MSSERYPGRVAPVTSEEFRRACGRFATGVTIASVLDGQGAPHGLTVSSFTSVSLDPPLISICLGHAVSVIHHFRKASHFGINILAEDQQALSDRFARKGLDRFDGVRWQPGATGVPLIPGVLATGIGFPTVAKDKARVRTIVASTHTRAELDRALEVFRKVGKKLGILG